MEMLGVIENIESLIWTRRYWECGEFKLLVPFTSQHNNLLKNGNIIMKHSDDEAAEIKYVNISKNLEGYEIIEAQGKFLTYWLSKRVIATPLTNVIDTAQNLIYRMVDENCINTEAARRLPNVSLAKDDPAISGDKLTYNSELYAELYDSVVDLAQGSKIGFAMRTNRELGTHSFSVYKGNDYTEGNTVGNPPCIFSQEYDNVLEQEYTESTEKYKTTAYVTGEEIEGEPAVLVIVNGYQTGLDRNEMYVSGGDIKQSYKDDDGDTEITLTDDEYREALTSRGREKLDDRGISKSFRSDINTGANLIYRVDYDVGDRITSFNKNWNVRIDARITEVSEVYEKNGESLELVFGESLPSLYKQIKQMTEGG